MFWNLLKNAVKFTPAGGTIRVVTSTPEPGRIEISVIDPGIGIAPEDLPRLFNAFEQGNPEITRSFGGLGLGLAICKALVDQHGGTLTGVSPGRGQGAVLHGRPRHGGAARRRGAGRASPPGRPRRRRSGSCWSRTTSPRCR